MTVRIETFSQQAANWQMAWQMVWKDIEGLPETTLTSRPQQGGWSIQQVIQHLALSEQLSLTYLRKKTQDMQRVPPRDIWYPLRKLALKTYLRSPFRFTAPSLVTEDKFPRNESMDQTINRLKSNQEEMMSFLLGLPSGVRRHMVYRHPIAGRMDIDGMFMFFADHIHHHQRQIRRILADLPTPGIPPDKPS